MSKFFSNYLGYGAVVLSAFFFGLISQLTKLAYSYGMSPLQLLTLQSGMAALLLAGYGLLFRRSIFLVPQGLVPKLIAHSLIGCLGTNLLFAFALVYLPASLGTMLLFTYPVLVTVGAVIFLHQKVKAPQILALILAISGAMLSTRFWQMTSDSLHVKGILLGVGSALAYAFFNLYGETILAKIEPLTSLTYVQLISAIVLLLFQLPAYATGRAVLISGQAQLVIGLALGTVASIIPFWLLLVGIKHIGASKASIIGTLELPAVFLMSYFFLGEQFSVWQMAGAVLILSSVVTTRILDANKPI